ncbi:hypothetical protein HPB48_022273 [Haemaphysalis longicornis]|uniref:Transposable element P transposase-like RNase H C-terminal domain-containing protein n=1 Tax=Haemaphysalis longicornis TaxID=44386 RepID=A0A9J6G961_HAELO|nr:hypothetical protein HPB48_022273 [Haemaphysalis longicornis]
MMNDMFDALNRKVPREGVRTNRKNIGVLRNALQFLDSWESELRKGEITKEMFLTRSTSEGLRVTLSSTIALCEYLLSSCGFRYVLTSKMNQDPIECFFGTVRRSGCQNDHPTMPTFLQVYHLLSVYKLIRPPKFGNCQLTERRKSRALRWRTSKNN